MSRRRYPSVGQWDTVTKERWPYPPNCMKCGGGYSSTEKFLRRETQTGFMRGDDLVETRHIVCPEQNGAKP